MRCQQHVRSRFYSAQNMAVDLQSQDDNNTMVSLRSRGVVAHRAPNPYFGAHYDRPCRRNAQCSNTWTTKIM